MSDKSKSYILKNYTCLTCGRVFKRDDDLTHHINNRHVTDIRKDCNYCEKKFNNNYILKEHQISQHKQYLRNQCENKDYYSWQTVKHNEYNPRYYKKRKYHDYFSYESSENSRYNPEHYKGSSYNLWSLPTYNRISTFNNQKNM